MSGFSNCCYLYLVDSHWTRGLKFSSSVEGYRYGEAVRSTLFDCSSSRTRDRFSIEFQQVEQRGVDGVGNPTPEVENQLKTNLSYQRALQARQGVPYGGLIRVQLFPPPPPPRDDYRATVRYIEYTLSQLKNGIVSQQMVDSAKETVRRLRSKGYSSLDEDEAITLKDSIHFLGRLESTPSPFRERFLNFAEDIPSRVRCLRQMQETLIDQPNLVEQERQCIAEIQNRMQARALRNQQFDEEEVTVICERAKREEEKEVLITRLEDIRCNVTEISTASSYIDGGRI
ncbi:uncharacterized protein LOC133731464 [Rosa rugosa]|uniref:uncharacterized protein LOC133731464 n=1 Tax=Rosa rugosa TaxID=74645 RepID=UPI002B4022D6|nr:uncharacterized protein LOC133731464 [Rosa rugosa]